MKRILLLFRKPYLSHETRSLLWMMHHFHFHLQWVWSGEGVKWLTSSFQLLLEDEDKNLNQLVRDYQESLYFEEEALVSKELAQIDFIFSVQPLSSSALMEKMTHQDIIFTF
ncbi:MAG: DsrE family protein [Gammaproteobacteria bacterium]|nr:DsrE family protein [Gammaproteobacteria bacterium]